jgi:hypothetical protein
MLNILNTSSKLPRENLAYRLGISPGSKSQSKFEEALNRFEMVAQPKSIFRVAYVENRSEDSVTIDNQVFSSRALRFNLDGINRVFPFLATCGLEVEHYFLGEDDIISQYWFQAVKLAILTTCKDHLQITVRSRYGIKKLSEMNPGSGDESIWPLEEQAKLFSLLGGPQAVEELTGVKLLPSDFMIPDMSVSGILFPNQQDYVNCKLCQQEDCPSRSAAFDVNLWNSINQQTS